MKKKKKKKKPCHAQNLEYGQAGWWNKQGVVYTELQQIDFPTPLNIEVVHSVSVI